ncbi:hypothetical protein AO498_03480 [Algoriphagus sanaruensis]|uniref:Uncharacterized protein n=1 Tax=Algoriphagus sanaruensis TaxID=1727163 RepID=A0A142EJZ2_9BACT|nr:hypothetical protein AO498_03480 [Algoriphagus sanaruensis]
MWIFSYLLVFGITLFAVASIAKRTYSKRNGEVTFFLFCRQERLAILILIAISLLVSAGLFYLFPQK